MNQREQTRMNVSDMTADISDRIGFSTGIIKDISRSGICITNIPRDLKVKDGTFCVVVSKDNRQFKLLLKQKWVQQDGLQVTTGATIDRAPWDWTAMLLQLEPSVPPLSAN